MVSFHFAYEATLGSAIGSICIDGPQTLVHTSLVTCLHGVGLQLTLAASWRFFFLMHHHAARSPGGFSVHEQLTTSPE